MELRQQDMEITVMALERELRGKKNNANSINYSIYN